MLSLNLWSHPSLPLPSEIVEITDMHTTMSIFKLFSNISLPVCFYNAAPDNSALNLVTCPCLTTHSPAALAHRISLSSELRGQSKKWYHTMVAFIMKKAILTESFQRKETRPWENHSLGKFKRYSLSEFQSISKAASSKTSTTVQRGLTGCSRSLTQ